MPSNKDRLYIGLYARDVPNTYHWAFLITPKAATGAPNETIRYHVVNRPTTRDGITKDTWSFEKRELVSLKTQLLLVRVLVAKIERSHNDLEASLLRVPVIQDDPSWRCRTWVKNALTQVTKDRILGTGVLDWDIVERECLSYVERKKVEGRFQKTPTPEGIPTYDLIEKKETAP